MAEEEPAPTLGPDGLPIRVIPWTGGQAYVSMRDSQKADGTPATAIIIDTGTSRSVSQWSDEELKALAERFYLRATGISVEDAGDLAKLYGSS